MAGVSRAVRDAGWIAAGALVLGGGWLALRKGMSAGDPRGDAITRIRAEADERRDIVVLLDDSPDALRAFGTAPVVRGLPNLTDLDGFRRLYAVGPSDDALVPFAVRLGPPSRTLAGGTRVWDLDGLAHVRWDLLWGFPGRVRAARHGGAFDGPCEPVGPVLRCRSTDEWNHLRVEPHTFAGVSQPCIFGHPQKDSTLSVTIPDAPPARRLVGMFGIDDAGFFPQGSPVDFLVTVTPKGGTAARHPFRAENRRGASAWAVDLHGPSDVTLDIHAADAGARQFCFTAMFTD